MDAVFKSVLISLQIGILLSITLTQADGKTFVVAKNTNGKKVTNVNRLFVSTDVKRVLQCAVKCRNVNCTSFSYGEKLAPSECYTPSSGMYSGRQSLTVSGEVCARWDEHSYTHPSSFPADLSVADAANFCRYPGWSYGGRPWCHTTNPAIDWQYCPVTDCTYEFQHDRCYKDSLTSKGYNGPWNRTRRGKVCQRWDVQSPHIPRYNTGFPDNTLSEAENYCRDPSDSGYTWCYTTDPGTRWEACDVTSCTKFINDRSCYESDSHLQYKGPWDITIDNYKCQRWDSQTPKTHRFNSSTYFPDGTLEDAGNYCRDPNKCGHLWCLAMGASAARCKVGKCLSDHVTCYDGPTVRSYIGTWSKTATGRVCQRWDSQEPHSHSLTADMFEEDTLSDAENFCRDPTGSGELWCYTTDPDTPTESCGIGNCSGVTTCQVYKDEMIYTATSKPEYYKNEL